MAEADPTGLTRARAEQEKGPRMGGPFLCEQNPCHKIPELED